MYNLHMTISVAVVGASGYAGGELLRLVGLHPDFEVTTAAADSKAGHQVSSVHPHLHDWRGREFSATDPTLLRQHDLVFLALPHGASAEVVSTMGDGPRIVDLGADFRLANADKWSQYYSREIPHAGSWQYGLPELVDHTLLASATHIANPGCYATAICLAAAPAVWQGLIDSTDIVAVAASGTSGAGRGASENLLASEVMGSISSYKTGGVHQHTPEIEQTLSMFSAADVRVSFTPLLAPMPRGIHATVTARLSGSVGLSDVREAYESMYSEAPFVQVLQPGEQPRTANVLGTNFAQIQVLVDEHSQRLVVTAVIDNLVKGAAGQAIQNANLMFGLAQQTGLHQMGVAP